MSLSARLKELKLPQGRLKTGTPPRLDGRSIDFSRCRSSPATWTRCRCSASSATPAMHPRQLPCWITHTNERTHEIIRTGFDRSPMFTGVIEGVGPRYCPSIEDKINRFADKDSHQIFLEPEGLTTHEFYPNGISTSLPFDVQLAAVRSMRGLENAHILRPGYAIEYDYFDPRELKASFETEVDPRAVLRRPDQRHHRLRGGGGPGLCTPAPTPRCRRRAEPWCLRRDEAYLGVLVDDLITQGVTEPYRMFTSRAEFRLQLREDNADLRLTETGRQLGLVDDARWDAFCRKRDAVSRETERLKSAAGCTPAPARGRRRAPGRQGAGARIQPGRPAAPPRRRLRHRGRHRWPRPAGRPMFHVKRCEAELGVPLAGAVIEQWRSPPNTQATSTSRWTRWQRAAAYEQLRLPAGRWTTARSPR
jgi:tRNA uridine 5-carboxymethylaminomethyl modification enzyme